MNKYKVEFNSNIKDYKISSDVELNDKINKLIVKEIARHYFKTDLFNIDNCFIEYTDVLNNCLALINKLKDLKLFDLLSLKLLDIEEDEDIDIDIEDEVECEEINKDILDCIETEENSIDIKSFLKNNKLSICKDFLQEDCNYTLKSYYLRAGGNNSVRCYFTLKEFPKLVFKDNYTIKNMLKEKTNKSNYCKTLKTSIRLNCYSRNDKGFLEFIEIY